MPDDVVTTAEEYARHQAACDVCKQDTEMCDEGLALMRMFQDALNAMLSARHTKSN